MWIEILLIVATIFLFLYWFIAKNFGKWERLGFPCISGHFPYGSHKEFLLQSKHLNDISLECYQKFKDYDYYGSYLFGKPVLNIRNLDMAKDILVKNFNCFVDRNDANIRKLWDGGETDQIWAKQLTNLYGDEWKDVRSTFSPIFSSGKMRGMYRFMHEVGNKLTQELINNAEKKIDFEYKELFGQFSLDTLANCAFGINPNSFQDKENLFCKNAARMFETTGKDMFLNVTRFIPGIGRLQKAMNISIQKPKETKFFNKLIKDVIKNRRQTGERVNDLIDLMIDCLKEEDNAASDSSHQEETEDQYDRDMKFQHSKSSASSLKHDEDVVISTAMVLLLAGYDTTGMALSFLSYQLAKNPDIQQKLRDEVDEAFESNDGNLPNYTDIQALPYLDACVYETLRIHPPLGTLFRTCTKDVKLYGTDYTIRKNDMLTVAVKGIQMDEKYYPNPTQFNPENFSKEAKQKRSPYAFLTFGQGPRACMGMRFALLEAKVAIALALRKVRFLESDKTAEPLQCDPTSQLGYIKGGIWGKVELISEE